MKKPKKTNAAGAARAIRAQRDPKKAVFMQRFFRTGKGEYGAGDVFLGLTMPVLRSVVREFADLPLAETLKLLKSRYHEERLGALLILVRQFSKGDEATRKKIAELYLRNARFVNNWDLVDSSATQILGIYLLDKPRAILYKLARSKHLWSRRIAIIATFAFIRRGEFKDTLRLSEILLDDTHDLMHKAVGWMLREVGKRDEAPLVRFLDRHALVMPRTMLRYSLEKFSPARRQKYMARKAV